MDISALYIKHLPVSNQYVICILQNGEVQTVNKNHTNFDSACKALDKIARTQKNLFYIATENLYLNITKITAVRVEDRQVIITCDGKNFTTLTFNCENNARNYANLLRRTLTLNRSFENALRD